MRAKLRRGQFAVAIRRGLELMPPKRLAYASPDYLLEVAVLAKGQNAEVLLVLDSLH